MTKIDEIKTKSMELRKNKSELASFSSFVLSEIVNIGKNDGNRETTEDEVISAIKKMIEKNKSSIPMTKDGYAKMKLEAEIDFLRSFLPEMVSEDEICKFLRDEFGLEKPLNMGIAMGAIKQKFGSLVDMKQASSIVKETYDF